MKKIYFLSSIVLFSVISELSAQSFIVNSTLGFQYEKKDAPNAPYYGLYGSSEEKNQNLAVSLSLGKAIGEHLIVGVGINYGRLSRTVESGNFPQAPASPTTGYFSATSYPGSRLIEQEVSPLIYVEHFTNLSDKFMLSLGLTTLYSFSSGTFETGASYFQYNDSILSSNYSNGQTTVLLTNSPTDLELYEGPKKQALQLSLQPILRYKLFNSFGLELRLGGINYMLEVKDSANNDTNNNEQFSFDFDPKYWKFGFFCVF